MRVYAGACEFWHSSFNKDINFLLKIQYNIYLNIQGVGEFNQQIHKDEEIMRMKK